MILVLAPACHPAEAVDAQGFQGVVEHDTVVLAFEVAGRVGQVAVREGDHLEGTVVVAKLDESLARPERDARAAELDAARAELALLEAGSRNEDIRAAEADLASVIQQQDVLARQRQRQLDLVRAGAAPSATIDDFDAQATTLKGRRDVQEQRLRALRTGARKQEIEAARARVNGLQAALMSADAQLARFELSYQGSADVLEVHVKVGEVVGPGGPAFTVADLDHPYVDVFVPQSEISRFQVGQPAAIRVDALNGSVRGRVERIGTKTEFTPRFLFSEKERANLVIRVRIRIDDLQHALRAGVPAFVTLAAAEEK
jgi:HlyD family secretion protein